MATLMDFIMAQRGDQSDPRFAANQQAMELQNLAANAQRPGMMPPPAFAGGFSPTMQPMQRAPMMMAAPPLSLMSENLPPIPPSGVPVLPPAREIGAAPGMGMPLQPPRPANIGAPMQLGSAAPSVRESFMQRLLGGPNYQSNSMPVMPQGATTPQQINFGNPDNPADFVRADRALMGLPEDALRIAGLLG
jgi:hypothetical protein